MWRSIGERMVFGSGGRSPKRRKSRSSFPLEIGSIYWRAASPAWERKTTYNNYEIVVVDNDSQSKGSTREYFNRSRHRVLHFSGPFNFSAINNFAVEQTDAPWLLFLNNDVEVIENEWLTAMAEHVQRPEVGAVGARLLFRDETIQHAGIVLGVHADWRSMLSCGFPAEHPGVCRQLQMTRNYSAVTAACFLTRR